MGETDRMSSTSPPHRLLFDPKLASAGGARATTSGTGEDHVTASRRLDDAIAQLRGMSTSTTSPTGRTSHSGKSV